ncbi:DNA lyase [Histoplasma capsulatum]|uniref:Apurinic-apyrimidinic endonuclease 1 n=1 Tax=Ajellomyces capsulatus TaxID=5037 RepID=A0A8A1MQ81_AJECA|nr:DNA lyase [Histoplasma capsulatum]
MATRATRSSRFVPNIPSCDQSPKPKVSINRSGSPPAHTSKPSEPAPPNPNINIKTNGSQAVGTFSGADGGAGVSKIGHTKKVMVDKGKAEILQRGTKRKATVSNSEEERSSEEEVEAEYKVKAEKRPKKNKVKEEATIEMNPLASRTTNLRMFVGAHISAAKGVQNAVTNSLYIGGNAFALFLKSQRKWDNPPLQSEHRDQFRQLCLDHNYDASKHVLPHGSYLVNLAQEDPTKAKQAYDSFLDDLKRCEELGIKLYNFHPGATNKASLESSLSRLAQALVSALKATTTVVPVLETMCGHGTTIGGPLSHFKSLLALIPDTYRSRIGICVDTCHSFAAGYDLRSPSSWNNFMEEFDKEVGLQYLRAFHLNDSKTPLGSRRDLHANIGTGFLGLRAFHNLMNDKRLEGIPMILETPIDRPAKSEAEMATGKPDDENGVCKGDHSNETDSKKINTSAKKGSTKKAKPGKPVMIEDKSIWAKEIKLLESLIGMDTESHEFLRLEAELAEQGKEEREKHQTMFDKKQEKESKQRDLRDMFSTNSKVKGKSKSGTTGAGKRKKSKEDNTDYSD